MDGLKYGVVFILIYICFCEKQCFVIGGQSSSGPAPEIYSLHITSDVKYRFATTLVTSRVKNPDVQPREAIFDVTLPNEAFITNLTLEIDGRIVVGEIKEKEAAKQQYEAAKSRGESAGYIGTQHRNTNKFNLAVTVAPSSKVSFNLTYQELLRRRYGHYEQVIYIDPGQPVPDMDVTVAILESREITELFVPPLRNDVDVDIAESNSIAIIEQPNPKSAYIKYIPDVEQQSAISANGIAGKFVVKYDVEREMDGGDLLVVNGYFVHFFAPDGFSPIPKDVLFVLDTSDSMIGKKIRQLRQAMTSIMDQLRKGDRINIMTFSGSNSFWKTEMLQIGDEGVLEAAKRHVESLSVSGWTNINSALTSGLEFLASRVHQEGTVRSPLLLFLTDGEATEGARSTPTILQNVQSANEGRVPIFSLAFGSHADYDLVKKVAIQNDGLGRKIFEASDAALQISSFYEEISVTLLNNVTFKYLDAPVANVTKNRYMNYFKGSEMVFCGRMSDLALDEDKGLTLEVQSNSVDGPSVLIVSSASMKGAFDYMSNMTGAGDFEKITEKVWAYLTIKQLLDKELAATDLQEKAGYNRQVLALSLEYGFVTPLTSMVVTQGTDAPVAEGENLAEEGDGKLSLHQAYDVVHNDDMSITIQPRTMNNVKVRVVPRMYPGRRRMHKPQRQYNSRGRPDLDPPSINSGPRFNSPTMFSRYMQPPPYSSLSDIKMISTGLNVNPGARPVGVRRQSKRKYKAKKNRKNRKKWGKQQMKLSLKVNMTSLEVPVCFNLFDADQLGSANYVMYDSPSRGVSVVATLKMVSARPWVKHGVVESLQIRTPNSSTNITSRSFAHSSTQVEVTNSSQSSGFTVTIPNELSIQTKPKCIEVDFADMSMIIRRSNDTDWMSIYVDSYTNVTSDVTGIIGEIVSRNVTVAKMQPGRTRHKKMKHSRKLKKFGILQMTGPRKRFPAVMGQVATQGSDQSATSCWIPMKNERRLYTIANNRV